MSDFPPAAAPEGPRREPIFAIPSVIVALIAALIAAYAAFDFLPPATQDAAISLFAFLPGRMTLAIWPERLSDLIARGWLSGLGVANHGASSEDEAQASTKLPDAEPHP